MQLEPGLERREEFVVSDRLVTDVGGTIGVRVLSTPGMIAMMERCASILAYENLPEGRATVGFEVCVKHVAAAARALTAGSTRGCARSPRSASCASTSRSPRASARSGLGPTSAA